MTDQSGPIPGQPVSADVSASAAQPGTAPAPAAESRVSVDQVKLALRRVKDPELNLNIMDLGLVYDVRVDADVVTVDMSLTSPGCPSGAEITADAEQAIRAIPNVLDVTINLVWTPYWSPERIEPRVRAYLGF